MLIVRAIFNIKWTRKAILQTTGGGPSILKVIWLINSEMLLTVMLRSYLKKDICLRMRFQRSFHLQGLTSNLLWVILKLTLLETLFQKIQVMVSIEIGKAKLSMLKDILSTKMVILLIRMASYNSGKIFLIMREKFQKFLDLASSSQILEAVSLD